MNFRGFVGRQLTRGVSGKKLVIISYHHTKLHIHARVVSHRLVSQIHR